MELDYSINLSRDMRIDIMILIAAALLVVVTSALPTNVWDRQPPLNETLQGTVDSASSCDKCLDVSTLVNIKVHIGKKKYYMFVDFSNGGNVVAKNQSDPTDIRGKKLDI